MSSRECGNRDRLHERAPLASGLNSRRSRLGVHHTCNQRSDRTSPSGGNVVPSRRNKTTRLFATRKEWWFVLHLSDGTSGRCHRKALHMSSRNESSRSSAQYTQSG